MIQHGLDGLEYEKLTMNMCGIRPVKARDLARVEKCSR